MLDDYYEDVYRGRVPIPENVRVTVAPWWEGGIRIGTLITAHTVIAGRHYVERERIIIEEKRVAPRGAWIRKIPIYGPAFAPDDYFVKDSEKERRDIDHTIPRLLERIERARDDKEPF